jgi:hypothetical protein
MVAALVPAAENLARGVIFVIAPFPHLLSVSVLPGGCKACLVRADQLCVRRHARRAARKVFGDLFFGAVAERGLCCSGCRHILHRLPRASADLLQMGSKLRNKIGSRGLQGNH